MWNSVSFPCTSVNPQLSWTHTWALCCKQFVNHVPRLGIDSCATAASVDYQPELHLLRKKNWYCYEFYQGKSIIAIHFSAKWYQRSAIRDPQLNVFVPVLMEFFLNRVELSLNSVNLINHWIRNWAQFKDLLCFLCLAGTVVASWSLTGEVAGSSPFNDEYFFHWIGWFQWKHCLYGEGIIMCLCLIYRHISVRAQMHCLFFLHQVLVFDSLLPLSLPVLPISACSSTTIQFYLSNLAFWHELQIQSDSTSLTCRCYLSYYNNEPLNNEIKFTLISCDMFMFCNWVFHMFVRV